MRDDIAKKLVERPRYGGGGKYNLRSERRKGKNPEKWEELPQKESCKKVNIRNYSGKYLSEYFAPLLGFLRKNVGRPWNKVNSEIREHLSANSTTHKHVLDHLYGDFVETNPFWVDGKPHYSEYGYKGSLRPIQEGRYYVDRVGLLKEGKKVKYQKSKAEVRKPINDYEEYRKLGGSWFWVQYKHLRIGESGYDVILNREFKVSGMYGCWELQRSHGDCVHDGYQMMGSGAYRLAVDKRQCSKQTIKAEGLNKL